MNEAKLGILGGMGPQATQDFYQRILDRTAAACDQEHMPTVILTHHIAGSINNEIARMGSYMAQ